MTYWNTLDLSSLTVLVLRTLHFWWQMHWSQFPYTEDDADGCFCVGHVSTTARLHKDICEQIDSPWKKHFHTCCKVRLAICTPHNIAAAAAWDISQWIYQTLQSTHTLFLPDNAPRLSFSEYLNSLVASWAVFHTGGFNTTQHTTPLDWQ